MQDEIKLLYAYFLTGGPGSIKYMSYRTWYLCKRVLSENNKSAINILINNIMNKDISFWLTTACGPYIY